MLRNSDLSLLRPGDRIGVAVSGGADSVALLRSLLEARAELGVVLSVVHFNHQLRGEESQQDERFVEALARQFDLPFHRAESDTRTFAREKDLSLEAAARELRYGFFGRLIKDRLLDKVATAHTLDDQAETVLLRIFRGTGTSGLSGIQPRLKVGHGAIIRPLLSTRRREVIAYLNELNQQWREDSTNVETTFTRNRLRHELLPAIAASFNPGVVDSLANLAEIARAEDEFWAAETAEAFVHCYHHNHLKLAEFLKLPLALQRRVLRLAAIQQGASLDFAHSERILHLLKGKPSREDRTIELPNAFRAVLAGDSLHFESTEPKAKPCGFHYTLPVPGEVAIPELRLLLRASVVTTNQALEGYNDDRRLSLHRLTPELMLRNWRPGDRFWPAHTRSEKKVKQLLQEQHVPSREKALWPVALAGNEIVWMRGFAVSARHAARPASSESGSTENEAVVVIEELPFAPNVQE